MRRGLAFFLFSILLFVLPACGPNKPGETRMYTGKSIPAPQVWALTGRLGPVLSASYAEVSPDWLSTGYQGFRDEVSAGQFGIVRWDDKAKCTFFAFRFADYAQQRYFAQGWGRADAAATTAGVGVVCYLPHPEVAGSEGHAINVVLTPQGVRYFEPQTGQFVTLSPAQAQSVFLQVFE